MLTLLGQAVSPYLVLSTNGAKADLRFTARCLFFVLA